MANIDKIRLSGVTYTLVDSTAIHSLVGYATQDYVTAATDTLATIIAQQGYQTSGDVQNAISGKADTTAVTQAINSAISGKADTTAVTQAISDAVAGKANTSDLDPLFGAVEYDSSTHRINFKHNSTGSVLAYVDASPFIIDGMVDNVQIVTKNGSQYLEVTFNSDAGKQAIDIALTDIFDPSNYYTKTEIDEALAGKANSGSVISGSATWSSTYIDFFNNTASGIRSLFGRITAGNGIKANRNEEDIRYGSFEVDTDIIQEKLTSGTNIKTINNQSILGSGNITIESGTVDSSLSSTSENAVQNKVVNAALSTKNGVISIESETLIIS